MIVDLILTGILIYLLWFWLLAKPSRFPPGPPRWPIFGNVHHLRKWGPYLYKSMTEMKRRYGEVAGFFVGPKPIILVSGLDAIKELSFREDLSGRPMLFHHKLEKVTNGILFTHGERWKEQRRFTLRHLRDFGFGKSSMESITIEEIEAVFAGIDKGLEGMEKSCWSKPIVVHDILGTANINIIWHILAGRRYSFSDPYLNQLLNYIKEVIARNEIAGKLEMAFPKLAEKLPFLSDAMENNEKRLKVRAFIEKDVMEHKQSVDLESPRDFIDIYLAEMEKRKGELDSTFSDQQLIGIGMDLFSAGYDTTFNTIVFALLYMILNPEVQNKVQEELDHIIGSDRLPSFQDRDSHRIPYTEATVLEILRCSTVVPMSVPHAPMMKDIEFRGHVIPKDAQIFLNLYELHHDPDIWGDPHNFRPERFLNDEGKIIRNEALIPFGIGKRSCLGESLARNNVFLFFTCLMQRYSLRKPEGEPIPSDEPVGAITIMPKPFKVQVRRRH